MKRIVHVVGTGTIVLTLGAAQTSIVIAEENNTLEGIRDEATPAYRTFQGTLRAREVRSAGIQDVHDRLLGATGRHLDRQPPRLGVHAARDLPQDLGHSLHKGPVDRLGRGVRRVACIVPADRQLGKAQFDVATDDGPTGAGDRMGDDAERAPSAERDTMWQQAKQAQQGHAEPYGPGMGCPVTGKGFAIAHALP